MFQYKQTNKKTGITYLFEQESYWVPDLKQSRSRRRCLGKYNENGELVTTGKRGRTPKNAKEQASSSSDLAKLTRQLEDSQLKIKELEQTIKELQMSVSSNQKAEEMRSREIHKIIQSLQKLQ